MITLLKKNNGQFIPISMMIMFTMVIFMVAIVNVYQVTRAKLKVQNLADAAALNLASQEAQAFNIVADRNEWLNHMIAGVDPHASGYEDCSKFDDAHRILIPGISCVENNAPLPHDNASWQKIMSRHIFHSQPGAKNYAALIETVNEAQFLFIQAYNSFLGDTTAGTISSGVGSGPGSFVSLLKTDMPELAGPGIHMVAWNSSLHEPTLAQDAIQRASAGGGSINSSMVGLKFKVDHDIQTRWYIGRCINLLVTQVCTHNADVQGGTLGDVYFGSRPHPWIGWVVPDPNMPQISVQKNGVSSTDVGVGVFLTKDVHVPVLGNIPVTARAKAYVVKGSGESGESGSVPHFQPTYWAKLAN